MTEKEAYQINSHVRRCCRIEVLSERTRNIQVPRERVYEVIDEERDYQDQDVNADIMTVGDELVLIRTYLRDAEDQFKEKFGDPHEAPAMDVIRKMAAICVRCMEHHGAPARTVRNPRKQK